MKPDTFEEKESARVAFLRIKAKREANKIHVSKSKPPKFGSSTGIRLNTGNLIRGFSSPAALGDVLRRVVIANANRLALQDPGKVLVKDGKPTTKEGAALLKRALKKG